MQEIDPREIIAVLLKHKYWIAALAVVAAIVTAVVSLLLSPTYQATALVAVTKPRYTMQFDPRFTLTSTNIQPPYKAYPVLAMSDEVLSALVAQLGDQLSAQEQTLSVLRGKLDAKNGSDPSIIRLRVKDSSPQRAAAIANAWAEGVVDATNELYDQSSGELTFYAGQKAEAEAALAEAEQALVDFQARNQAAILETQLTSQHMAMDRLLQAVQSTELVIQDARVLKERLQTLESSAPAVARDELTALLIQINALNHGDSEVQLQLSPVQDLGDKTIADQISFLDSLILVLEERIALLDQAAQELEPGILALQETRQEALAEENRLITAQTLAQETFVSLSNKATEARIAAQDSLGDVRLASRATPITDPISPRKTLNTLAGGVLGLLAGIVIALAIEYWRRRPQEAPSS